MPSSTELQRILTARHHDPFSILGLHPDGKGHVLLKNQPVAVCDKTAGALSDLNRDDIFISNATYHYDGGGCC